MTLARCLRRAALPMLLVLGAVVPAWAQDPAFKEITVDGYTFPDRNGNGTLDIYEDNRRSVEARADDL